MARILAYVVPAAGHLFPFVPGLQQLQRRGHHVHVRTGEKLLATAREAGLDVSPADPGIAAIEVNDYAEGKDTDKFGKGLHDMLRRGPLGRARDVVLSKLVERLYARSMLPRLNALRAEAGLRELRSPLESPPRCGWRAPS